MVESIEQVGVAWVLQLLRQ